MKDAGKKFLLERIADSDRYFPTLQTDDTLRTYLIDQVRLKVARKLYMHLKF